MDSEKFVTCFSRTLDFPADWLPTFDLVTARCDASLKG